MDTGNVSDSKSRLTRVRIDDETWSDFRLAIGQRSVSKELGKLVEREVARYRRTSLQLTDEYVALAIDDARALKQELSDLLERLEKISR